MDEKLFEIILGIISLTGLVLTGVVIPLIKEKISNEKLAKYEEWATLAVHSAEMLFSEKGMGKTKKQYVIDFLNEMFNKNKVVITKEQLEILVESAVKSMKLEEKQNINIYK